MSFNWPNRSLTNPKFVTDEMFIEAARATADQVTEKQLKMGMLFPPQSNILNTEVRTAERVARLVFERSLARVDPPKEINAWLRAMLYKSVPSASTLIVPPFR